MDWKFGVIMNRREVLAGLSATVVTRSARPADAGPEIAFTFDDPKTTAVGGMRWQEVNDRILGALGPISNQIGSVRLRHAHRQSGRP